MNYEKVTKKTTERVSFDGIDIRFDFDSSSLKRVVLTDKMNPSRTMEIGVGQYSGIEALIPEYATKFDCVVTYSGLDGETRKMFDSEYDAEAFGRKLQNDRVDTDLPEVKYEIRKVFVPTNEGL